jgi:hypothetical protein
VSKIDLLMTQGIFMSHQHHSLGSWRVDESGLQPRLDRRVLVRSALGAGAAMAALLGSGSVQALTLEKASPALLGAIPPRKGVVPWDDLREVDAPIGQKPKFPIAMKKLNGRPVVIEGHMMVLEDDDPLDRFLLSAYKAHCPFCSPGGFASVVAIHARPVRVADKPLTMRGTLRLLTDGQSRLFYELDRAVVV